MKHKETWIGVLVLAVSSLLKIGSFIALYSAYAHKQENMPYSVLLHDSIVEYRR
ncbi:MAG TPA: hypothetical protein VEK38_00255 [Candidatus Bathyarchaeia archaeon]|nr:hypothetical protein [Candidatus Bathyarchaeia archaeon]